MSQGKHQWYILRTISGKEMKVKEMIEGYRKNNPVYAENISPFTYVWDDPNGIENVNVNDNVNKGEEAVYDLSGRKVISKLSTLNSQLSKGIYIINGKKILIK